MNWNEEPAFKEHGIPTDSVTFWTGVRKSEGFRELADFAFNCLVVPVSNAVIERLFSLVTATKTKTRNKLGVDSLDAIGRIKAHLQLKNMCCREFIVTPTMLQLHTSQVLYKTSLSSTARASAVPSSSQVGLEMEEDPNEAILQFL